jgi:hypothetical protein
VLTHPDISDILSKLDRNEALITADKRALIEFMVDLDDIDDLWHKQQLRVVAKRLGIEIKQKSRESAIDKGWRMVGKVKQGKK